VIEESDVTSGAASDAPLKGVRPSSAASLAPGRPASTSAIDDSICRNTGVYRACGRVRPSTCSANVTAAQRELLHLNRRTTNSITTGVSPTGASRSCRMYRPCTRQDGRTAPRTPHRQRPARRTKRDHPSSPLHRLHHHTG
jgi:hypothetical protein